MKPEISDDLLNKIIAKRIEFLEKIVSINSFTENVEGVNKVQDLLEIELKKFGYSIERHPLPGRGDFLVAFSTAHASSKPILLVGHADTVHTPESGFLNFSYSDDKKKMMGPGVYDMKGSLVQILCILDILKEKNLLEKIPLKILINSAEEDSTDETRVAMRDLSIGGKLALVFEFGRGTNNGIVVERKGIVECEILATGKASHAGIAFYEGKNAIVPLCECVARIAHLSNREKNITVNIGKFHGGSAFNVVAEKAIVSFEIRAGNPEDMDATYGAVQEILGDYPDLQEVTFKRINPLYMLPETKGYLDQFMAAGKKVGVNFTQLPQVGGISDANIICGEAGVPTIDGIGPTGAGAHTLDEYANLDSLLPRTLACVEFLEGFVLTGTNMPQ